MLKHSISRDRLLATVAGTDRWRLVCSALPHGNRPIRNENYSRWLKTHLHRHSQKEILFCLEGETIEHFAGHDYRCRPGTVFLIDANEEHAWGYPEHGRSFVHLWITGLETGSVAIFYGQYGRMDPELLRLPLASTRAECDLLARCWNTVKAPPAWMTRSIQRSLLTSALFPVVMRSITDALTPAAGEVAPQRRLEIITTVQRHIEAHLAEAEDLDTLAHLSGYSKFHFARLFKESSGQTVHGFVNSCRMRKAEELGRLGLPCKEISCSLGFSSPAAFSNWARKNRGSSRRYPSRSVRV